MSTEFLNSMDVHVPVGKRTLKGDLVIPENSDKIVLFSHGSGSGRFSSRNRYVAESLQRVGISTFLFDLLTQEESEVLSNRFDIELLTDRLSTVLDYLLEHPKTKKFRYGVFGASTGAASALNLSAKYPEIVKSLVSRGGRVDLSTQILKVKAATLLIVGELDNDVLKWNEDVYNMLTCEKSLKVIKGAGHLFEEEGKLIEVTDLAVDWFKKTLI